MSQQVFFNFFFSFSKKIFMQRLLTKNLFIYNNGRGARIINAMQKRKNDLVIVPPPSPKQC